MIRRLFALACAALVSLCVPTGAMAGGSYEVIGWVQADAATWASSTTFTIPSTGSTAARYALGTPLKIKRAAEGDTTPTEGFVVTGYAAVSGTATVTVDGPGLGAGSGALTVYVLDGPWLPMVVTGVGVTNADPEDYAPGWAWLDMDDPDHLRVCEGALGARSWSDLQATDDASVHSGDACGGGLGGTFPNCSVTPAAGLDTTAAHYADGTAGSLPVYGAGSWSEVARSGIDSSAVHSGDACGGGLGGTFPNCSVTAAAGLDTTAIHSGDAAGGGLGGTFPNPSVTPAAGLDTTAAHYADGTAGYLATYGAGAWAATDPATLASLSPRWDADFSTTWDATSTPTGPTGWTAAAVNGTLGAWTTLGFSGGVIRAASTTPGTRLSATLTYDLDAAGYAQLRAYPAIKVVIVYTITTLSGTPATPGWTVTLGDSGDLEAVTAGVRYDTTNRFLTHNVARNGSWGSAQNANDASYTVADSVLILDRDARGQLVRRYEPSGHTEVSPTDITVDAPLRAGLNKLKLFFDCTSSATLDVTITSITITGLMFLAALPLGSWRRRCREALREAA